MKKKIHGNNSHKYPCLDHNDQDLNENKIELAKRSEVKAQTPSSFYFLDDDIEGKWIELCGLSFDECWGVS